MNIVIDYPTFSADRLYWCGAIDQAQRLGHSIYCVTRSAAPIADLPPGVVLVLAHHDDYLRRATNRLGIADPVWITSSPDQVEPSRACLIHC